MRWTLAIGLVLLAGCAQEETKRATPAEVEISGEVLEREVALGPVTANVRVQPSEPRLGDVIELELEVVAEPGIEVEMPVFGEALGRHAILSYTPREKDGDGGSTVHSQTYRLQASASGRMRIPRLRVVFRDPEAATDSDEPQERELLTDEIAIHVASVLPEEGAGELRPPLAPLREDIGASRVWIVVLACVGAVLGIGLIAFLVWRRRRASRQPAADPYGEAMRKLAELEARGLPGADEADLWYVDLSGIVRHYLEERFGLRAPELTTEEFLREAQQSEALSPEHKTLLGRFLADCDRVKFAGYRPEEEETQAALATARRFVEEAQAETSTDGGEEAA